MFTVHQLRKIRKISIRKMAELMGISVKIYRAAEKGKDPFTVEQGKTVALLLNCPYDLIIF